MRSQTASHPTDSPLVSVVIPTYGRATLLGRALASVLRQTLADIEVLVVDDCSPDHTARIVEVAGDRRIRYLRHERHGGAPAATRNTGIRAASGRYIAFLDDDDEWAPIKLERQLQCIQRTAAPAALCAWRGSAGLVWRHARAWVDLDDLRCGNRFAPGSGLLVDADVVRALLFDESLGPGEDWDLLIRIARCGAIAYVNEILLFVDEGEHPRITKGWANPSRIEEQVRVLHKNKEFFGSYWIRRHTAAFVLSSFTHRNDRLRHVWHAVRQYGPLAVSGVLGGKAVRAVRKALARRGPAVRA